MTDLHILNGKQILIADDDAYNIYALEAAFEEYGMVLTTAANGVEAVNAVKASDAIDMVLMDMMMPEMDGYEAMRTIRSMAGGSALPIIALTARAMKNDVEKCLNAGATAYMSKPIDIDKLLALMCSLIKG